MLNLAFKLNDLEVMLATGKLLTDNETVTVSERSKIVAHFIKHYTTWSIKRHDMTSTRLKFLLLFVIFFDGIESILMLQRGVLNAESNAF